MSSHAAVSGAAAEWTDEQQQQQQQQRRASSRGAALVLAGLGGWWRGRRVDDLELERVRLANSISKRRAGSRRHQKSEISAAPSSATVALAVSSPITTVLSLITP